MRYPFANWELPEFPTDKDGNIKDGANEFVAIISLLDDIRAVEREQLQTLQQINAKLDAVFTAAQPRKKRWWQ